MWTGASSCHLITYNQSLLVPSGVAVRVEPLFGLSAPPCWCFEVEALISDTGSALMRVSMAVVGLL